MDQGTVWACLIIAAPAIISMSAAGVVAGLVISLVFYAAAVWVFMLLITNPLTAAIVGLLAVAAWIVALSMAYHAREHGY